MIVDVGLGYSVQFRSDNAVANGKGVFAARQHWRNEVRIQRPNGPSVLYFTKRRRLRCINDREIPYVVDYDHGN